VEDAVNPAPDGGLNRGETPCSGAANYATTLAAIDGKSPSDHVILTTAAGHGGTTISQLAKSVSGTSVWVQRLVPHITNGMALSGDYSVQAVAWLQGENDSLAQTPFATYRAALQQLRSDIESLAQSVSGQATPVYCLTYQLSYGAKIWPDQALAQLDLAQKNEKFTLVTPCYHLPFADDNIHLTAIGYKWIGAYFGRAYKQLAIDGMHPRWLDPLSATLRGKVLRVRFNVPVTPLVLDTTTLAVTLNNGFKVNDSTGAVVINGMSVDGDSVLITLNTVPDGAAVIRYALDYLGAGLIVAGGASGNLRDSAPEKIVISGAEYPLYNVCPHFQLPITVLGE